MHRDALWKMTKDSSICKKLQASSKTSYNLARHGPSGQRHVSHALTSQEQKIQAHETQLNTIATGVKQLTECQDHFQQEVVTQVNQLNAQLQQISTRLEQLASPQPTTPGSPLASFTNTTGNQPSSTRSSSPAEKYSGVSSECRSFLVQCDLHFKNDPAAFLSEQAQVAFMVSHLSGRAAAWVTAEWARGAAVFKALNNLYRHLPEILDQPIIARSLDNRLLSKITHRTQPLTMTIDSSHGEFISALETKSVLNPAPAHSGYPDLTRVPPCYHDLREVFNKTKAMSLPPHRPWDCSIDLLPGAPIPKEEENRTDYILIFSPDPATHQLHVHQVLTRLLESKLFVKAEKCEFHASSVSFLGFIVSPSHIKMDPEKWGPEAEGAFQRLKRRFTTAPVLTMPDPKLQFIVEVDAFNEGQGSQNAKPDALSHLYEAEPAAKEPEPILPPDRVVVERFLGK
ncbi:hypothetical protein L3Q82_003850 [Scortum barcoo]|uniref:Uncharacterized protein n=1 Tax=Scortum barcoo TaxID=214431 RepID=A0ACB8X5X8_9TELE|nr:hypothetical protein L3Q82_003850 [Scortum barcoo]